MKKAFTLFALMSSVLLFSQNEIGKKVREYELSKSGFTKISPFSVVSAPSNALNKYVDNATYARLNIQSIQPILINQPETIEIEIPYNGTTVLVDLYKVNLFAEGFQIDTDKQQNIGYKKGVYYRGIVKGDYTSVATFNFFDNEINGLFSNDQYANVIIGTTEKNNPNSDYIIFGDAHLKITNDFNCGFKDDEQMKVNIAEPSHQRNAQSTRCVTMYFEIDNDLYTSNNNSTTQTTNWMTSVFNNVQTLYTNDGITVSLKSMFIWTTQDPYEGIGTSSSDYLFKFNEVRPVFNGDVGQLVGIDPGGLGGVAVNINGLCSQDNFSYSDVTTAYAPVLTYSWTIEVITHEFGHLLGSPHTHACIWNGNNTAIDNCGPSAIGASGEGFSCMTNPPTIPSSLIKGTIMSYCHLVSSVGIRFNNGFGTQPKNAILNAVNSGVCLSTDCVNTCINSISQIGVTYPSTTSATVTWTESGSYTSWNVRTYPFNTTPPSWSTVSTTSYTASSLTANTYYVFEVAPVCTAGLSIGGRKQLFVTPANFCSGITFTDSGGSSGDYTNMETVVRTIIPNLPNNKIVLTFSAFSLEADYDYLFVYDGNSTSAPDLSNGGFTGATIPGPFTSTASDGSLTVKFYSDQGVVDTGFEATISCSPNLSVANNKYVDFSYYPNPSNGMVNIASKTAIKHIEAFSITGQLLYTNSLNDLSTTVDISTFATGTYFFKIQFENDQTATIKILKK
jgi:hypothetical protein